MPETLYTRDFINTPSVPRSFTRYKFKDFPERKLNWKAFVVPVLKMARYPSVVFPALYYSLQFGLTGILPGLTTPVIFPQNYSFDTLQVGVAYGVAIIVGAGLGEVSLSNSFTYMKL
jgi:hypothetical protein